MIEPQAIRDRRDVVGTLPAATVTLPRDLAERALAALRSTLTGRGHLAQRNTREGEGYCSWRAEAQACVERRGLIEELSGVVEGA